MSPQAGQPEVRQQRPAGTQRGGASGLKEQGASGEQGFRQVTGMLQPCTHTCANTRPRAELLGMMSAPTSEWRPLNISLLTTLKGAAAKSGGGGAF